MKRALALSLCVMLGLLMGSVMTAWAGPTVGFTYLNYDEDVGEAMLLPAYGISYVHEFGRSLGGWGDFKITDVVFHVVHPWEFAFAGYLDVQATYDITLFAVDDVPVIVFRPGCGFVLPLELAVLPTFAFGINDPGLVASAALILPYEFTIRGEVFYSAKGFGWALGGSFDLFGLESLFRRTDTVGDAP